MKSATVVEYQREFAAHDLALSILPRQRDDSLLSPHRLQEARNSTFLLPGFFLSSVLFLIKKVTCAEKRLFFARPAKDEPSQNRNSLTRYRKERVSPPSRFLEFWPGNEYLTNTIVLLKKSLTGAEKSNYSNIFLAGS
jgi:hypothetical protein